MHKSYNYLLLQLAFWKLTDSVIFTYILHIHRDRVHFSFETYPYTFYQRLSPVANTVSSILTKKVWIVFKGATCPVQTSCFPDVPEARSSHMTQLWLWSNQKLTTEGSREIICFLSKKDSLSCPLPFSSFLLSGMQNLMPGGQSCERDDDSHIHVKDSRRSLYPWCFPRAAELALNCLPPNFLPCEKKLSPIWLSLYSRVHHRHLNTSWLILQIKRKGWL